MYATSASPRSPARMPASSWSCPNVGDTFSTLIFFNCTGSAP
jgi:hypothetical protein